MNAMIRFLLHAVAKATVVFAVVALSGCGGAGGGAPTVALGNLVPVAIGVSVPGQLVAKDDGVMTRVLDIMIGDAHALVTLTGGVNSVSFSASGADFATLTDTFNAVPGARMVRTLSVPQGANRRFTIQAYNGVVGATGVPGGAIIYTGFVDVPTLQANVGGTAVAVNILVAPTAAADVLAPVITVPAPITVAAQSVLGTAAINPAITAFLGASSALDAVDGASLPTHNAPVTFPIGTTTVTFSAKDTSNNLAIRTSTVTVRDQLAPVMSLSGATPIQVAQNATYVDAGVTITDNIDTGLVAIVGGAVNTAIPAVYTLTYDVSDAAGNQAIQLSRVITVVAANTAPTLINNIGGSTPENRPIAVTTAMLQATDIEHTAGQLTYVMSVPFNKGVFILNGVPLAVNATFTQADIDNGLLVYQPDINQAGVDTANFNVTDPLGLSLTSGGAAAPTMTISITAPLISVVGAAAANISAANCNTVWNANQVYHVTAPVTIATGCSLLVDIGTRVKFAAGTSITAQAGGDFSILGAVGAKVSFTSDRDDSVGGDTNADGAATVPVAGGWGGIVYATGSTGLIKFADFFYVANGLNVQSSPTIADVSVQHANGTALNMAGAGITPSISNLTLTTTANGMVFGAATSGTYANVTINAGPYAISLAGQPSVLSNISINTASLAPVLVQTGGVIPATASFILAPAVSNKVHMNVFGAGVTTLTANPLNLLSPTGAPSYWSFDTGALIDLAAGNTLNVDPGAVLHLGPNTLIGVSGLMNIGAGVGIKAELNCYISANIGGTLNVNGSIASGVSLTSFKDDLVGGDSNADASATLPAAGDWYGIIYAAGSFGTMTYADVSFTSRSLNISSSPIIDNLLVSNVSVNTLEVIGAGAAPTLTNIQLEGGPMLVVGGATPNMSNVVLVGSDFNLDATSAGSYSAMLIDNALVTLTGVPTAFDSITFQNYASTATPLTMAFVGMTKTFNNLQFLTQPTTGNYIAITGGTNVITVAGASRQPLNGTATSIVAATSSLIWGLVGDDSDADGLADVLEAAFGTDPLVVQLDHDGDGMMTHTENLFASDPASSLSLPAAQVIGQTDSLGVALANARTDAGGVADPSPYGLRAPSGMDIDVVNHRLFVADSSNNRVLVFQLNITNDIVSRKAINVIGQADFELSATNRGNVVSASTLSSPLGVSYFDDGVSQWLTVADSGNNRVLIYNISGGIIDGMSAVKVLGQTSFSAAAVGVSASNLNTPAASNILRFGAKTYVLVADYSNDRVLFWDVGAGIAALTNGQAASVALGQVALNAVVTNGTSTVAMDGPASVAQWGNTLFVSDRANHRILAFNLGVNAVNLATGLAASNVIGQTNFITWTKGSSAAELRWPRDLTVYTNYLMVADKDNSRVLVFDLNGLADGMAATFVYGQTALPAAPVAQPVAIIGQNGIDHPFGLAVAGNRMLVSAVFGDDILSYDLTTLPTQITGLAYAPNAIDNVGQNTWVAGMADGAETPIWNADGYNNTGPTGVASPREVVLGTVGGTQYLFVADNNQERVLAFAADVNGMPINLQADFVLGKLDFEHQGANIGQAGLGSVRGLAFDAATSRLFVSDSSNHRVLMFDLAGGMTSGMNAAVVFGQPDFVTGTTTLITAPTATGFNLPVKMVVGTAQGVRYLFVVDGNFDRILLFDISGVLANGMTPSFVLGGPDFVTNLSGADINKLSNPTGVDFDPVTERLFVADSTADRVLIWDLFGGITNGMPASFMLGQTVATSVVAGLSQSKFNDAQDVVFDAVHNVLWVTDRLNNRIMGFNLAAGITTGMNASYVLGQADFVTSTAYTGDHNRTAYTFDNPRGLTMGPGGRLVIASDLDDRIQIIGP